MIIKTGKQQEAKIHCCAVMVFRIWTKRLEFNRNWEKQIPW